MDLPILVRMVEPPNEHVSHSLQCILKMLIQHVVKGQCYTFCLGNSYTCEFCTKLNKEWL